MAKLESYQNGEGIIRLPCEEDASNQISNSHSLSWVKNDRDYTKEGYFFQN